MIKAFVFAATIALTAGADFGSAAVGSPGTMTTLKGHVNYGFEQFGSAAAPRTTSLRGVNLTNLVVGANETVVVDQSAVVENVTNFGNISFVGSPGTVTTLKDHANYGFEQFGRRTLRSFGNLKQAARVNVVQTTTIQQCTRMSGYHWNAHSSKCERTTTTTTIARRVEVRIKQCRRSGRSWDHVRDMCLW